MAVKIRLKRLGANKKPVYRIIAIDSRKARNGRELEILGTYDPHHNENTKVKFDLVDAWIAKGAIPTETVKNLIAKNK